MKDLLRGDASQLICAALAHMRDYLPAQGPLHSFVHHNTLHAFEHMPFEKALVKASQMYKTQAFLTEREYAKYYAEGRIRAKDIDEVIDDDVKETAQTIFSGGPKLDDFKKMRLRHYIEIPNASGVQWAIDECSMLYKFYPGASPEAQSRFLADTAMDQHSSLNELWHLFRALAPPKKSKNRDVRPKEQIFSTTKIDIDALIHPLMIRWCAAFIDQGISYWPMPQRKQGLLSAVRLLYGQNFGPPDRWLRGLSSEFQRQEAAQMSAEDVILWAFARLNIPQEELGKYVEEALLSLRGWAGLINQLELKPHLAPAHAHNAKLMDYLALFLTLDVWATEHAAKNGFAQLVPLEPENGSSLNFEVAYEAFVLAQIFGFGPARFEHMSAVQNWLTAVANFDETERCRLLQLAFERQHLAENVAAIVDHAKAAKDVQGPAMLQAVFCIDAREESFRRYVEEVFVSAQTFGYAGFFGVSMAYQGLEDVAATPSCPIVTTPTQMVKEYPLDAGAHKKFVDKRRLQGHFSSFAELGKKTLLMGWFSTAVLGPLASIILVGMCIAPRLMRKLFSESAEKFAKKPVTRLLVERPHEDSIGHLGSVGFNVDEMTAIVKNMLLNIGLVKDFAPIVLVVGHGSSSLNNPHASAYNCAATRGGKGGPNARAICIMANNPEVRLRLLSQGISIPDTTWFLAIHHNTCDESITYFDEDLIPQALGGMLAVIKQKMKRVCMKDAHERCRRFDSVPTDTDLDEALVFAQERSFDIRQPRPEFGNATNALCVVGRRALTRDLFLDRRAFLTSYDHNQDPSSSILESLLQAVIPVCQGINLEYYFSYLDPSGYGSGTKLPHNIVGLVAVMDGHSSDLRTGLPWQTVELHEPLRLVTIVEAEPQVVEKILDRSPDLRAIVHNRWIHLIAISPTSCESYIFREGSFSQFEHEALAVPEVARSIDHYFGRRGHLPIAKLSKTPPRENAHV